MPKAQIGGRYDIPGLDDIPAVASYTANTISSRLCVNLD